MLYLSCFVLLLFVLLLFVVRILIAQQNWLQWYTRRLLSLIIVLFVLLIGLDWIIPVPAIAAIRQIEEAPGQVVYQSRYTLNDQMGNRWQAIAFKRIRPDGSSQVYLRLVGFPGTVAIDRSQPLTFRNSVGQTLLAADASSQIFTDARAPEPNVGQYNLQPVLAQLQAELPWRLSLPTTADALTLRIPPWLIEEWQDVANMTFEDSNHDC